MHAPNIVVRTLSRPVSMGSGRVEWQYHSRSDRHSKVACWGVFLDLLAASGLLRDHVAEGKVVFGVNHSMHDFVNDQRKDLDLVVARPGDEFGREQGRTLEQLGEHYGVDLDDEQRALLGRLPTAVEGPVGSVLIAMEAKACNDGGPVRLVTEDPAPQPGDLCHYDSMIRRVAAEYDSSFRRV